MLATAARGHPADATSGFLLPRRDYHSIRGLSHFIADLQTCDTPEAEAARVANEMAKLRTRLGAGSRAAVGGYESKKAVWKMLYCAMLGYRVEGYGELLAQGLVASPRLSEKTAGYISCGTLLAERPDLLELTVNTVRRDLMSSGSSVAGAAVTLALHFVADCGTRTMHEALAMEIQSVAAGLAAPLALRKKALAAIAKATRTVDPLLRFPSLPFWGPRLAAIFKDSQQTDVGFLTAAASLALAVVEVQPPESWEPYLLGPIVECLQRFSIPSTTPPDALYRNIPAPWLRIRLFRILQRLRAPARDSKLLSLLESLVLEAVLAPQVDSSNSASTTTRKYPSKYSFIGFGKSQPSSQAQTIEHYSQSNAEMAVFFECVKMVLAYGAQFSSAVRRITIEVLSNLHRNSKDPNILYLQLQGLSGLALDPAIVSEMRQQQMRRWLRQLEQETDPTIRRQLAQLAFRLSHRTNWRDVAESFLATIAQQSACLEDPERLTRDLCSKVAQLTERFALGQSWHFDTILELSRRANYWTTGAEVAQKRLLQCMADEGASEEFLVHCARRSYEALRVWMQNQLTMLRHRKHFCCDRECEEPSGAYVRLCAYSLGEYGHLIRSDQETSGNVSAAKLLQVLGYYALSEPDSQTLKVIILATGKIGSSTTRRNRRLAIQLLKNFLKCPDVEVQDRAVQVMAILQSSERLVEVVFDSMPTYAAQTVSRGASMTTSSKGKIPVPPEGF